MDYLFIQGKNEYDDPWAAFPFVSDREKTQQQKLALGMVFRPESDWELTVNSALSEDRYRSYRGTSKLTSFATKSRQLSIAQRWNVSDRSEMLLGVDYLDEWVSGEGVSGYSRRQRDQTGYFGTWQGMYYPFSFLAALRTDHFSGNDSEISGNLEAGFMLTDTIQVLAGTGRAFKQPTMNDLYYSDPWGSSGNPALGAETGVTRELAVRFEKSSFQLRLGVYENSIDDLIQWTETVPGSWSYSPVNIASAQIKGTELEWSQTLGQNLAWRYVMNRLKTEDELTGNELNRRSKSTHSASLEWSRKNWMSNLEWMYVGSAWEDAANSRKIPSYQLVNARLVYRSGDRMEWRLTLKNLLDEQYESPLFYQGESRQVLAGIRFLID
jgi:vitamin B12 transporter